MDLGGISETTRGQQPAYIRLFGRRYLRGRKLNFPALIFLVFRDFALEPFFGKTSRDLPKRDEINEICVCKLDHLGDLLMATPFLEALRRNVPNAEVTLVVGSWCRELADILQRGGLVTRTVCLTAFSLNTRRRNILAKLASSFFELASVSRVLRAIHLDVFVDLRPYYPCAWLLAVLSRSKVRAGFGLRGMANAFHIILPYSVSKRLGQIYLEALPSLTGAGLIYTKPILPSTRMSGEITNAFRLPERYLVVQLSSRERARNIRASVWKKILASLSAMFPIVLLGLESDQRYPELEESFGNSSLIGKTTVGEFLSIIEGSVGVVSVDSFAAHVGLAYARFVAVLMVKPYSQEASYPEGNPDLGLFPGHDGVEELVQSFLTERLARAHQ